MTETLTHDDYVRITDDGFSELTKLVMEEGLDALLADDMAQALLVANDVPAKDIAPHFERLELIAITFPSFADGRGFSLATELRRLGFDKRLQARGHLIADQYPNARRAGFDEVVITKELAKRQPEAQWLAHVPGDNETYQMRLQQADKVA